MSTYCPLPFKHIFVDPTGIKPCCSYTRTFPGSISEWLASSELQQLQSDMIYNRYNDGCIDCLKNDAKDKVSTRQTAFNEYGYVVYDQTDIDYVDLRSSNVCNFKCRSCEPRYSSRIQAEVRRNPALEKFYNLDSAIPQDDNFNWILDNLKRIKRLMFTGGEPTQIPKVKEILLEVQRLNLDINIQIISNASFTDKFWIDITKVMPTINWVLSIDACGKEAEIIRDGTNWDIVATNVEELFSVASSVNIGSVVTNLNLLHLKELFIFTNYMKQHHSRKNNGGSHMISICNFPKHFSPYNWPESSKPYVLKSLYSASTEARQESQQHIIDTLIRNIQASKFDLTHWGLFLKHNQKLDDIRSQNFLEQLITIPI